jgi:hypothetical protein
MHDRATGAHSHSGVLSSGPRTGGRRRLTSGATGTKVELILNLTTGKAFGLTVPLPSLDRADEVIESPARSSSLHVGRRSCDEPD